MLVLLQNPVIVDLSRQPEPAPDISISVVLGMFAMAGVFLLAAAIGSTLVAGAIFFYKRWRDASAPPSEPAHSHTTLRI